MPDDAKKPSQTDLFHPWKPKKGDKSKKIEVGGSGQPKNDDWDPDSPDTSTGMIVIYDENTNHFKVSCGGVNFDINWDDMFPALPPSDAFDIHCNPEIDKDKTFTSYEDETREVYIIQNACSLLVYCSIKYIEVSKTYHCDRSLKKWVKPHETRREGGLGKLNVFTCPCGGK